MLTASPTLRRDADELQPPNRLTTQSLRDDEIRAIADGAYRDDNPLRFEGVRHAALMFERAGYMIMRSEDFRQIATPPQEVVVGQLVVDALRRLVFHEGREIELKPREFDLLDVLARHPGQVFTRTHLLDLAWPRDFDGDWRTIDVHVRRIRRRLGEPPDNPRLILTVHGVGYKLAAPQSMHSA